MPAPKTRVNPWLVMTVLTWGTNFAAIKEIYRDFSPQTTALLRMVIMQVILIAICAILKVPLRYTGRQDFGRLMLLGVISMGIYIIVFLIGMAQARAADASILISSSPIWVVLFGAVVRLEPWRPLSLVGAVIALGGIAVLVSTQHTGEQTTPLGALLLLSAAMIWAIGALYGRVAGAGRDPLAVFTLSLPGSLPLLLVFAGNSISWEDLTSARWQTWGAMFHMAVLAGVLGFFGFFHGLKEEGPTRTLLYQFFVPPVALLAAALIAKEAIHPIQIVGLVTVITGVYIATRNPSQRVVPVK